MSKTYYFTYFATFFFSPCSLLCFLPLDFILDMPPILKMYFMHSINQINNTFTHFIKFTFLLDTTYSFKSLNVLFYYQNLKIVNFDKSFFHMNMFRTFRLYLVHFKLVFLHISMIQRAKTLPA